MRASNSINPLPAEFKLATIALSDLNRLMIHVLDGVPLTEN